MERRLTFRPIDLERELGLAVSPTNLVALRFYERHGYRRLGLRPGAVPPVYEMQLELHPGEE